MAIDLTTMWTANTQDEICSFLANGGRIDDSGLDPIYIPALDNGQVCADGDPIEIEAGAIIADVPSKFVQTDTRLFPFPFWSADGTTLDEKEWQDFIDHPSFANGLALQWDRQSGNCVVTGIAQYEEGHEYTNAQFQRILDWMTEKTSLCGTFPEMIVDGTDYITSGGGLVYIAPEVIE